MYSNPSELVEEIRRLREELNQMREIVNMLLNVVMEETEDEEYESAMLDEDTLKRFNLYT